MSRGRGTKREISYAQIRRTKQLFFDLLDHASLLSCSDPRDRIYAFLGHPSARAEDGERLIIDPECPPTIEGTSLKLLGVRADAIRKCFRFHEYYHANY